MCYQRGAGEVVHVQRVHFLFQIQRVCIYTPATNELIKHCVCTCSQIKVCFKYVLSVL